LCVSLLAPGVCLLDAVAPATPQASSSPPSNSEPSNSEKIYRYHPAVRVPPSLESVLKQLTAGGDAFPEEREAAELAGRLAEWSARLREHPDRAADAADWLLAPDFKGGRLTAGDDAGAAARGGARVAGDPASANAPATGSSTSPIEIVRTRATHAAPPVLDRTSFRPELNALVRDIATIETAEFLITAIAVQRTSVLEARTTVRFDLAGVAKRGWRAERLGHWEIRWRRGIGAGPGAGAGADNAWRIVEWTAQDQVRSRAAVPVFTDVTETALGGNRSFREQLVPGLDTWASRLDAVFMPRGMGHHGISVGDADGDGLDDIYVSQPEGLPNRLFRNRGDGTFEDVTEAAGLAILDRTSQSLFADVDNDGDQDLILLTQTGPLLFLNDGTGRFTRQPDAFRFEQPLQGSLTSAAMADYDRDGFLDLYLCAYGYFIGVSEDKAGPPSPYHDALNGSPNVLLRNDGHGHFVDVTRAVGLDAHNDRFSFAAAWADYDEDGWPDLLVANDFGRKNLYHHDGMANGQAHFTDVAAEAGVEDYGAGMSAAFVDYDNDGHVDIYTGNMWSATGQRVTAEPGFKPDAPADVREIYRRHARGNSLFRNEGHGKFADVTLAAGAEFGRWAWSSDAFDFDNDGWEDLYVVNGMFTRDGEEPGVDVDSFFWRQVVAQSPLTRTPGTPYDDGWRATNRLLVSDGAQAQHERNVLLRNDGHGGFDEISGTAGLDVDQDGRAFAVFDYDADGDPDIVLMAPRSSPQLRLYRNDFATGHASVALHLRGTTSNRDAIGARVRVETERSHATRIVMAGSGFLSQHSKTLLFGLGDSQRLERVIVTWPSGLVQTWSGVPLNSQIWLQEGRDTIVRAEPFRKASAPPPASAAAPARASKIEAAGAPHARRVSIDAGAAASAGTGTGTGTSAATGTWLYEPVPAPDFTLRDLQGEEQALARLAGRPVVLSFWATSAPPSRAVLDELSRGHAALAAAGAAVLALAVDTPADAAKVRESVQTKKGTTPAVPVMIAGDDVAGTYNILHRYLFDRREDLRLPTTFLIDAHGDIVKIYSGPIAAPRIVDDIAHITATDGARLARAVPFPGTFLSPPGKRSYFQYGLELSEQGFDAPALAAFERVARDDPSAITFYNLGTLYMKLGRPADARTALDRALNLNADYAEAHNTLGALLAQSGDLPGALGHFRAAIAKKPAYADALNNLGYAIFQTGQREEAYALYQRALALQPDFPEALNNVGIYFGQQRNFEQAERYFRQAVAQRPAYGEAANNLALVLGARGDTASAIALLERLLKDHPAFEAAYVTLCRLYVAADQPREGLQVLERLLQRNPTNPQGLQLLKQLQAAR
jgi:tetratricopeptide (TPR) repeat protein/peroxiredoxin